MREIAPLGAIATLLLIGLGESHGQTARDAWKYKHDDAGVIGEPELDKQVSDLSQHEQLEIWQALDEKWLKAPGTARIDEKRKLLIMDAGDISLSTRGEKQLLVRANGESGLCGATGNCSIWLFVREREHLRLVLSGEGVWIVVGKIRANGMPDLALRSHLSSSESNFNLYRWTGNEYKQIDCYIADEVGVLSGCPTTRIERK
jgi:hypothetical protein